VFKNNLNKKKIATVFLTVVFIAMVGFSLFSIKCSLIIEVVNPSRNDVWQVFYDIGNGINEADSKSITMPVVAMNVQDSAISLITIPLPAKEIKGIRIDPGTGPAAWNFKSIILQSKLAGLVLRSHTWLPEDIVRDFTPLHAIDTFDARNKMLFLNASGEDPYFGYKEDFGKVHMPLWKMARYLKVAIWIITAFLAFFLAFLNRRTAFEILKKSLRSTKQLLIPFSESQWIFPAWFWGLLGILTLIKLWLVGAQTFPAGYAPHDDMLFINIAKNIVSGQWLGDYNNLTLAKAPFYPFWIASMFWLGIPLIYSQQLLYVCSCLIFIIAIRPLLRNIPLLSLIFYTTLLFHPISYAIGVMPRVIREGVYLSLSLLVLSFAIGLLLRKDAPIKKLVMWNIGLGFSFAAFWLTREEGVILLPSLFLLLVTLFVSIGLFSQEKIRRIKVCCISIVLAFAVIGAVAGINKIYYGIFTTCEQTQSDLTNAYGSLLRVKPKPFQRYLPVSHEKRERIYAASPSFAELRPFLEGDLGKAWGNYGPYKGSDISTHFSWAFRDAVSLAGYYNSGDNAAKYYRRLASEVNNACDKGTLECYKTRHDSLAPIWHNEYLIPLISTSAKMAFSVMRLEYVTVQPSQLSSGSDEIIVLFKDMTRDRISPRADDHLQLIRQQRLDVLKLSLLNSLLSFFRFYMFVLVLLGIISYIWNMVLIVIKRKIGISFVIATALLLAVLARIFLLSLIHVTTWPNMYDVLLYRSSLYPLLAAFSLTSIVMVFLKDNDEYSIPFSSFRLKKINLTLLLQIML
jgi:hypothetical protein